MVLSQAAQSILAAYNAAKINSVDRNSGEKFEAQKELEKQRAIETLRKSAVSTRAKSAFLSTFGKDTRTSLQKAQDNLNEINARKIAANQSSVNNANKARTIAIQLSDNIGINDKLDTDDLEQQFTGFGNSAANTLNLLQQEDLRRDKEKFFQEILKKGKYKELTAEDQIFLDTYEGEEEPPLQTRKRYQRLPYPKHQQKGWVSYKIRGADWHEWDKNQKKVKEIIAGRSVFEEINNDRLRIIAELENLSANGIKSTAEKLELQSIISEASQFLEQTLLNKVDISKDKLSELRIAILDALEVEKSGIKKVLSDTELADIQAEKNKETNLFTDFTDTIGNLFGGITEGASDGIGNLGAAFEKAFNPTEDDLTLMFINMAKAQQKAARFLQGQES